MKNNAGKNMHYKISMNVFDKVSLTKDATNVDVSKQNITEDDNLNLMSQHSVYRQHENMGLVPMRKLVNTAEHAEYTCEILLCLCFLLMY
jgi:hypothetical protein